MREKGERRVGERERERERRREREEANGLGTKDRNESSSGTRDFHVTLESYVIKLPAFLFSSQYHCTASRRAFRLSLGREPGGE